MKQIIENLKKEAREKSRSKWGQFYYSNSVGFDWERPKKIHKELEAGVACIASRDIEDDQDKLIEKAVKATLEEIIGREMLIHDSSGTVISEDDAECNGYNAKRQEIIDKLNSL